ncbi:hypothetical protein Cfor_12463 [Coptotermes formosanus]|uniref:Endonuclease/exonuclease/phosphatase domain-containing protein n=1 Tax=Coptotermes formosanus TaxID=36987 RepID=A0A6L2PXF1_COPFO|nr:hypothetical protein Cfor_12463 [Coptotermes formosanus]
MHVDWGSGNEIIEFWHFLPQDKFLEKVEAPTGNFVYFLNCLDAILRSLYNINIEFVICGDINLNYLNDNNRRKQLDTLLSSYNLSCTVHCPTGVQNNLISTIDNIFIDLNEAGNCTVGPRVNGLCDHDGQIIYINNLNLQTQNSCTQSIRKFSKTSMNEFMIQLSYETWDNIFIDQDVDTIFNSFLNTYLRIFYSNFPKKQVKAKTKSNTWMTDGIKISCQHKRELY